MRACHNCLHWDVCSVREDDIACGIYKPKEKRNVKPQTNADRIRAMSDEELAKVVSTTCPTKGCPLTAWDCTECWLNWLKQPVKDGDNDG